MNLVVLNNTKGSISGGYKKYLNNLMPKLASNKSIETLKIYVPQKIVGHFNKSKHYYPIINNKILIKEILESKPDIIFCPTSQFTFKWPIPFVTMIRNMEPLVYNNKSNH